jgi:hypothetical protein
MTWTAERVPPECGCLPHDYIAVAPLTVQRMWVQDGWESPERNRQGIQSSSCGSRIRWIFPNSSPPPLLILNSNRWGGEVILNPAPQSCPSQPPSLYNCKQLKQHKSARLSNLDVSLLNLFFWVNSEALGNNSVSSSIWLCRFILLRSLFIAIYVLRFLPFRPLYSYSFR